LGKSRQLIAFQNLNIKHDCRMTGGRKHKKTPFTSLLGAVAFLLSTAGGLFAAGDFEHPNSYIGNADWDGGLVLWVEVAQISLEEGTLLPLRLRFSSKEKDSLFGSHWWCPLLEGRAVLPKSHFIEYSTLGGSGGYLVRKNQFVSGDGRIKGSVDGSAIEIASSGWVYRYRDGKITGATTPQGTSLVWKYGENDQFTGLQTKDGKTVAEMIRSGNEVKIAIPSLRGEFSLRRKIGSTGAPVGWVLSFPDGRKQEMGLEVSTNGVTQMTIDSSDGTHGTYRWNTETGALLSDADFTYEMRPTDIGRDLLNRVDSQGLTEWYYYDSAKGAATYKRQDGSRVVSWYDLRRGPSNMKVFRMDTISEDQKLVSSRLLSYTPEGVLEKEWTQEGERVEDKETRRQGDGVIGSSSSKGIRFIHLDEAMSLREKTGALFIDARPPAAFAAGAIPGAINLSRVNFERDYSGKENQLKGAETLVVYCTSRNCEDSSIVATKLSRLGYKNVLVFEGGWAEWWKHH
jgi:rhodanese-related sulfurtransferase